MSCCYTVHDDRRLFMKCITSDLDGTLLNRGVLSEKNKKAVQKIKAAGIDFVIATGRDLPQVDFLFKDFGFSCDCICLNGTIFHNEKGEVEYVEALSLEVLTQTCETILKYGLGIVAYTANDMVAVRSLNTVRKEFYEAILEYSSDVVDEKFYYDMREVNDYQTLFEMQCCNLEVMSLRKEELEACKAELKQSSDLFVTTSIPNEMEITSSKASKGATLRKVMEKRGIDLEDVIILGDSENDLSMFENFNHSIAMGNAIEACKQKASRVIGLCEEDGFAEFINEVVQ